MTKTESDCKSTVPFDYKKHWDIAYAEKPIQQLGWYEEEAKQSLSLITDSKLGKEARLLNIGVGTSVLIDQLVALGYTNIIANDLSEIALTTLKKRLVNSDNVVQYIVEDLLNPKELSTLPKVDLWNDRAVLHFFTKDSEQKKYFDLLKQSVKVNGYVIIAVFALDGAEKCCGLPLKRYNTSMLQEKLGSDFTLIKDFEYTFTNPYGGKRPYIYTLFKRTK